MNTLNLNHGPLNNHYLNRIVETLDCSLSEYPRTMAVRIDLRLPDIADPNNSMDVDSPTHFMNLDQKVISRFFASLQAQIKHDLNCKRGEGKRVHPCRVRYVWVRECSAEFKWHYHVVLFLNKDAYAHLGDFKVLDIKSNLVSKIRQAWLSALGGDYEDCVGLVYIPENAVYYLDANNLSNHVYGDFIYRCSYMAKHDTKQYGNGFRCFGCSQT